MVIIIAVAVSQPPFAVCWYMRKEPENRKKPKRKRKNKKTEQDRSEKYHRSNESMQSQDIKNRKRRSRNPKLPDANASMLVPYSLYHEEGTSPVVTQKYLKHTV
jgi:hypothetical protein